MKLIRFFIVLLIVTCIAAEIVFSPSRVDKTFSIPTSKFWSSIVSLKNDNYEIFSWEVVQSNGECEPITISPRIGEGYEAKINITFNGGLMIKGNFSCTISALCGTNSSQAVSDLTIVYGVNTEYCYDQPTYYCQTLLGYNSHCDRTTGVCICDTEYYGASCQRQCFKEDCEPHGSCNTASDQSYQKCVCDANYYDNRGSCDKYCEKSLNCSSNAHCNDKGSCQCEDGYYGKKCSTYCSPSYCSFAGSCSADGTCVCNTGRYGDQCQYITCPYCYKGTCNNGTGSCDCQEAWYGLHCDHYCNSTTSCGHGECRKDGQGCDCEPDWYGPRCENLCNSTLCGHGHCATNSGCKCDANWYGARCDKYCNCGVHGFCNENYQCECEPDYYGPTCDVFCSRETCSRYGTCNTTTGACNCEYNFYGPRCEKFCDMSVTCQLHGTCDSNGACQCDSGYTSANCNVRSPDIAPTSSSTSPTSEHNLAPSVIVLVIVGLAALILVAIVIWSIYRAKKNKQVQEFEVINN